MKMSISSIIGVAVVLAVAAPCRGQSIAAAPSAAGLVLDLRPDRAAYVLGEPIRLTISVRNGAAAPAALAAESSVWDGHVAVYVAFEDGPFREYRGPGWGLRDTGVEDLVVLRPGEARETEATVLYAHGSPSAHLNRQYAAAVSARALEEGYAIPDVGRYRLKAVLHSAGFESRLESPEVSITVSEPQGADRAVWEVLRANPLVGYFMQTGSPRGMQSFDERLRLMEVVDTLVNEHPHSRYATPLARSLATHRAVLDDVRARGLFVP